MKRAALFVSMSLGACTSTTDLSKHSMFQEQIGVELSTRRDTYIYKFPHARQSLWDHVYEFATYDSAGNRVMHREPPKATCPTGSAITLSRVQRHQRFDNPNVIEALGTIRCDDSDLEFRYVWGIYPTIHPAPWESADRKSPDRRTVAPDGT